MAIKITDGCINCDLCRIECPQHAIFDYGDKWNFLTQSEAEDKSKILKEGDNITYNGSTVKVEDMQEPLSNDIYFIVPELCTECVGFHDMPSCEAVCPVDVCVPDENNVETENELIQKRIKYYGE